MQLWQRLAIIVLVVACVTAMGVHHDTQFTNQWPYPTSEELATDYATYVGEEAFLFGTVESVQGDTARVHVESDAGEYTLTVRSFDATVKPGGVVQIVGVIRPDHVVVADQIAVVNTSGSSKLYKYAVSLVGAALVVVVFFRYWRLNTETLTLEARTDG